MTDIVEAPATLTAILPLEAIANFTGWEPNKPMIALRGDPRDPSGNPVYLDLSPKLRLQEGSTYLVLEPWRLLVRSYTSAVVYADGRLSMGSFDLPSEVRDRASTIDSQKIVPLSIAAGAELTDNVQAASSQKSEVKFHRANTMSAWMCRWEIAVKRIIPIVGPLVRVLVVPRLRISVTPKTTWTLAETRAATKLWARLCYIQEHATNPQAATWLAEVVESLYTVGGRVRPPSEVRSASQEIMVRFFYAFGRHLPEPMLLATAKRLVALVPPPRRPTDSRRSTHTQARQVAWAILNCRVWSQGAPAWLETYAVG